MNKSYIITYAGAFCGFYKDLGKACNVYDKLKRLKIDEIVYSRNFDKAGALLLVEIKSPDYSDKFKGFNTCQIIKSAEIGLCSYRIFVLKENK